MEPGRERESRGDERESRGDERESRGEELASLRIDRSVVPARTRSRALLPALVALAALLVGGAAWWFLPGGPPEVKVEYAVQSGGGEDATAEVLTGSGYVVTANRYISLGVRVPSRIERYLVEEGERVSAGQVLVELDARQYGAVVRESQAALRVARANVDLHTKELERTRELHRRDVASEADMDLQENKLRVAVAEASRLEAQVSRQEVDLEDTVLRAPTSGIVLEKFKEVGEIAVPGGFQGSGELIRMANLDELRAELDVNESDVARIHIGQPARVRPEAYPEQSYEAEVVKLYPQINRQKGTLKVEVRIAAPDPRLRPDMSVRVAFLSEESPDSTSERATPRVLAPKASLREEAGASFAWVVTEGRVRRQPLEVAGPASDGRVVIERGLSGGEALVVGEVPELSEGDEVRVLP